MRCETFLCWKCHVTNRMMKITIFFNNSDCSFGLTNLSSLKLQRFIVFFFKVQLRQIYVAHNHKRSTSLFPTAHNYLQLVLGDCRMLQLSTTSPEQVLVTVKVEMRETIARSCRKAGGTSDSAPHRTCWVTAVAWITRCFFSDIFGTCSDGHFQACTWNWGNVSTPKRGEILPSRASVVV